MPSSSGIVKKGEKLCSPERDCTAMCGKRQGSIPIRHNRRVLGAGRSDPMFRMSAVFNTVSDCFDFDILTQCFKERLRLLPWPQ